MRAEWSRWRLWSEDGDDDIEFDDSVRHVLLDTHFYAVKPFLNISSSRPVH